MPADADSILLQAAVVTHAQDASAGEAEAEAAAEVATELVESEAPRCMMFGCDAIAWRMRGCARQHVERFRICYFGLATSDLLWKLRFRIHYIGSTFSYLQFWHSDL